MNAEQLAATDAWGLWSFAREAWHPDPMRDDGAPLRYDGFIEAARGAAAYHESFQLVPQQFKCGPPKLE